LIPVYAPQIARVVDLGAALLSGAPVADSLLAAVEEADRFNQLSRRRFTILCASAPLADAQVQMLLPQIEQKFGGREQALLELREVVSGRREGDVAVALDLLQKASDALMELTGQLRARTDGVPVFSPMPRINELIRIGANVYNGDYPPGALAARLPAVAQMVASMEEDARLFAAGHPAERALADELAADVGDLQMAVGAIYTFLEGGQPRDLLLGLRLLGIASTNVDRDLRRTDEVARAQGVSPNQCLNALQTALQARDVEAYTAAVAAARAWLEAEAAELERIGQDFLVGPLLYEERLRPLEALHAEMRQVAAELDAPMTDTVQRLADAAARMDAAGARLFEALGAHRDYGSDLDAAQLSEIVRGAADGVVPLSMLSHQLERVEQRNRALSKRLAELRADAEVREAKRSLIAELQALEVMGEFLDTGDRGALARGLELFDHLHAGVVGIEDLLTRKEMDQGTVACMRCGTRNALGTPFCTSCRAPLPVHEDASLSSFDLVATDGEAGEGPGELFEELDTVCRAYQHGEAGATEVAAVLDLVDSRIDMNRRQLDQLVAPAVRANPSETDLAARMQAFEAALQTLGDGVRTIRDAVVDGGGGSVDEGLAHVSDAADLLARLRE